MTPPRPLPGFSLMEVVIAAGLFAGTVTVAIALLAGLLRQAGELEARLTARRLPDAIKVELGRLATQGFDSLAAQVPVLSGPAAAGFALVADADGGAVQALVNPASGAGRLPVNEQFFLVECWRYPDEPLRFDSSKACLALHVRVTWPYRLPASSAPVPLGERFEQTFAVCINR